MSAPRPGIERIAGRLPDAGAPLGRLGHLQVRLARDAADIRAAQRLRYRVFYEERNANAESEQRAARRDADAFDPLCDHLLVHDLAAARPRLVGTYRLLRQDAAERHAGFYSAAEFDTASLTRRHPGLRFLELGRSCVLAPYRTKRTVELLWHGAWTYVRRGGFDVMFGCASLDGTDPDALALPLSFLHHFARAPDAWRVGALPHRHVEMNRIPRHRLDPRAALRALPPLVKGYLRLGAHVGDGAVIDRAFGTIDVMIVLPVAQIAARYLAHFGIDATRHAA